VDGVHDLLVLTVNGSGRIMDAHPQEAEGIIGQPALDWLEPMDPSPGLGRPTAEGRPQARPVWTKQGRLYLLSVYQKGESATWLLRDVTDRVPLEAVEHAAFPVALWTLSAQVLKANAAFLASIGDPGVALTELVSGRDAGLPTLPFSGQVIRQGMLSVEATGRHLATTLVPCLVEGQPVAILSTHHDITQEVIDASRRETQSLKTMTAMILHEARNPLATVRGFLQLMATEANSQAKGWCELSIREVDRASRMLEEADVVAGPSPERLAPISVRSTVEQARQLLEASGTDQGDVRITVPSALTVLAEKNHFTEILLNLLRNGIEAGCPVFIRARRRGRTAVIEVADSGPGVPPGVERLIFSPFFTTKMHGNGLGLHISRTLAERLGGTLDLLPPEDGKGAVFSLSLPIFDEGAKGQLAEI